MKKSIFNKNLYCLTHAMYNQSVEDIEYWKEYIIERYIEEVELEVQKEMKGTGEGWCVLDETYIQNGDCGIKNCVNYKPINRKNGRCWHKDKIYEGTGKKIILSKDGAINEKA